MKIITLSTLLFFALMQQAISQFDNIFLGPGDEVSIAINPTNPDNIVAGANLYNYFFSFDGGKSWTYRNLNTSFGRIWGDPSLVFDADGSLYYAHLMFDSYGFIKHLVVQKSVDGGITYDDGVSVGLNLPKQQDKEWLAVDMTDSPYHNNIYMSWTEFDLYPSANPDDSTRILFSYSTNAGESWTEPMRINEENGNCIDGDFAVEGANPVVGPNGEVYVAWAVANKIMFDKSADGGATFGDDIFVTNQPGGWDYPIPGLTRCNGLPVIKCDLSGRDYHGNIYILWTDQRNGDEDVDVFIINSSDGGDTWGETVRVNDDNSGRPQFMTWMDVDQTTGYIYVIYYDRRNTTGTDTDVYVAKSVDGGRTFNNFKVNEETILIPKTKFLGDYTNIAAKDGKVYPIWNEPGVVRMAIISDASDIAENTINYGTYLGQNFPNPFDDITAIPYEIQSESYVTISIFDPAGIEIATLVNGWKQAGKHTAIWNAGDIRPGMYFYKIETNGFVDVKRCVVLR